MTRTIRFTGLTAAAPRALAWFAFTAAVAATALAQPSEAEPGAPDGPPRVHRDPLRAALDANGDFEIDADEMAKAAEAIKTLDTNGDGSIDREELRPPLGPPGGPDRGPGDRGFEGRPRRPGEPGAGPPRDGESPDGPRPPREGIRPGGGPPGDRPSPERFVERAKSFDADGDGKLDGEELKRFAESMAERLRQNIRGDRGDRGPDGPPRDGGERPERPRRPE